MKIDLAYIKKHSISITEPDFSKIDGEYIRRFRLERQMSQTLLADYLGVKKDVINRWEHGLAKVHPIGARMIYIMEKCPEVFSILKEINMGDDDE